MKWRTKGKHCCSSDQIALGKAAPDRLQPIFLFDVRKLSVGFQLDDILENCGVFVVERSSTIRCSHAHILFPSFAITSSAPIAFVISLQVAMQFSWSGFYCRKKKSVPFTPTHSSSSADNGELIPRIINIPVDFANADKEEVVKCTVIPDVLSQHKAAVLVQAWCRGYLVRKTDPLLQLREIHEVTSKLRELQSDLSDVDFIKRAQQNPKARVWLTESVMDLLFRLDAVQGAHEFVREIRKAVSREVVDCQDSIDALFSIDFSL